MSEKAKVLALFEDYEPIIRSLGNILTGEGYQIAVCERDMNESMKVAAQLNNLGVIAALVDGNLTTGETDNREGALITAKIHKKSPGVVVIGTASDGSVKGADYNVEKTEGPQALLDVLAKIFR
ncbi:MAG: hypothetical protein UX38_C0025G0006 [Microgenomates group bacterium GW2011_GWC1_46_16]|uniref:Response regulatory domain-containing protein n=1 Tax=Candidatus Collierbacteria bacterium RIFOXYA2_FULL_46_10 TaxID=1817726 RepID=A0A1F5F4S6_9BACT|nr:MAG: hypothetical protein UX38_C0025G0006 [Microgenomates group bacterium GW2011_GWC1_46_16]KKU26957.1 MAG: hypothetical protein UX40_C0024G0006 [Microgenomates group bacterium GW2011_GWF2_46_18]KKU43173.1 MAG: hypothetical protein UX59_C0026G0009 [Microgenomates group bacterium GW2011_GWA1_46_7]KKU44725.1 MAG: hypothetical protein UX63_C0024G0015 [Microgenomates group bacterium GW2011_GWB1_46_7]KKU60064.1 MAG: hypothetical protein UX82_C0020G0008 [Microgenomates group bacterium GW2011_GWE1_